MGCKYSCSCSSFCGNCNSYESEEYVGHAEDIFAQAHGYESADDWENAE
jgi:hypothetical protein